MNTNCITKWLSLLLALIILAALSGCTGLVANADAVPELYISEVVMSNSRCLTDEEYGTPDWIEIYNASGAAVNLSGFGLSDNIKKPHKWTFPAVTLGPGEYIVIYATQQIEGSSALCCGFGLSRSGETLLFSDQYYNVIQQLTVSELPTDVSYARDSKGGYGYCTSPTPGKANDDSALAYDLDSLVYAGDSAGLFINEVMPHNDMTLICTDGGYYGWAELENRSASPILLSNYYLSDNPAETLKWRMPEITLQPGDFIVVYFSDGEGSNEAGELHAPFKLGQADTSLTLTDADGKMCMAVNWPEGLPDDISVLSDGAFCGYPTPNAANSAITFNNTNFSAMDSTDPVRLNEVLIENSYSAIDADGDRSPWVELHNTSGTAVSLAGYCLSDDPEQPFKWALPDIQLGAGEYLVVFTSGKDRSEGELHTSFRLSRSDKAAVLSCRSGLRIDTLYIDANIGDNISFGRSESGELRYFSSPTPGAANTSHSYETAETAGLVHMDNVYINEVCAVGAARSGAYDWIELYNGSEQDIDLTGWQLSDDPDQPDKFTLGKLSISSGGYAVIGASASGTKEGVTAPFGISASGETLLLSNADGELIDVFETGVLRAGVSSGRVAGDASIQRAFFNSPTKNAANAETHIPGYVSTPVLSDNTLYHSDSFQLTITCATEGASIYYTTDGSKPTTASKRYTEPLTISQNTPLHVIAVKDGLLSSEVTAATYLFEEPHTVPVVCLSIDSAAFDEVYSVIDRWQKVEREGRFEYYDEDGLLGTAFPCGLRVSGASTLTMRQKSLAVLLRGGYGQSKTTFQFFPGSDVTWYKSLVLRNSGQDAAKARLRDSFALKAVKGMNIETAETRSVVVYINGQYWGLYDLNENQNEDYLESHYGVNADDTNIIRRNETPLQGTRTDFYRVRAYGLNTDMSATSKYEEFSQWVDVDYFMDYVIAQTYLSNADMFNQKYWRSNDYTVKWRPVYFDLDYALSAGSPSRNILPSYFNREGVPSQDLSLTNMDIFCGLRTSPVWCDKFCQRYVEMVYTQFSADRLISILDEMEATMKPEMTRHITRWGLPSSLSAWEDSVDGLRDCLKNRGEYALKFLQREFNLSDSQMQAYKDNANTGA